MHIAIEMNEVKERLTKIEEDLRILCKEYETKKKRRSSIAKAREAKKK